jgi:uncharacterized protein YgiM (DUF1202 family)
MTKDTKTKEMKTQEQKARSTFIAEYEERGRKYGAKLDVMVAKIGEKKAEAKADYQKKIAEMKGKVKTAQKKLDEIRASGDGKWQHFKTDLERLWGDVEVTFKGLAQ